MIVDFSKSTPEQNEEVEIQTERDGGDEHDAQEGKVGHEDFPPGEEKKE